MWNFALFAQQQLKLSGTLTIYTVKQIIQGDHFPDHMKFPDFSLTFPVEASKDYPVLSVYRYRQQSLFHINEKQGKAR